MSCGGLRRGMSRPGTLGPEYLDMSVWSNVLLSCHFSLVHHHHPDVSLAIIPWEGGTRDHSHPEELVAVGQEGALLCV